MNSLPIATDYLNKQFEKDKKIYKLGERIYNDLLKLAEEAEQHRIDYDQRSRDTEQINYWHGRRDEAGHFRDRLLAFIESLGR